VIVYRICRTQNSRDLSGTGARIFGGRWNYKGVSVVYTSESKALATLEYLVHVPLSLIPDELSLTSIKIPNSVVPKKIRLPKLPRNWRDYPAPAKLAKIGSDWVLRNETLLLKVPSAIIKDEFNILLNPAHRDMRVVKITDVEKYKLDERLFKNDAGSRRKQ
jgi:RES domain-containing protein